MVGRFVEQQQVRAVRYQQGQCQPCFFTTGERLYGLEHAVALKPESAEESALGLVGVLRQCGATAALDMPQRVLTAVEHFERVLREVADDGVLRGAAAPGEQFLCTGQYARERALAGAVAA